MLQLTGQILNKAKLVRIVCYTMLRDQVIVLNLRVGETVLYKINLKQRTLLYAISAAVKLVKKVSVQITEDVP